MRKRFSTRSPGLLAAWLWVGLAGCSSAAQSPAPGASPAGAPADAVAVIDGVPVTRAALDERVAPQIAKLDEQAYELRKRELDDLIATRLLDAEAKRRGVTTDALVAAEITAKVAPVTQADLDQFVAANRSRIGADPTGVMPQIRAYLEAQRTSTRREAFLDELRANSKVEVLLRAPAFYRAKIDLTGAPSRGPADAPVTVVEFSDFHCPFCRRVQATLRELMAKYPTQVRLVYKHFPLDSLHPQARRAAEASWCAQQQDRFWQFHDLVYANPPDASDAVLVDLATKGGLDVKAFEACLASGKADKAVEEQAEEGSHYGVDGTPGFFVNGRLVSGAIPLSTFSRIVDEELAAAGKAN
jgi:predicted DsbA family dithiol-disulfide isomerase